MGYRRKARECALQMLFQLDMAGGDETRVRRDYWLANPAPPPVREYADRLVQGVAGDRERIDAHIGGAAEHWRLERMAHVDRNVMRVAVYEFLHEPETPRKVAINEALEIVKKFGSAESTQFVNGVLDAIRRELEPVAGGPRG